MNIQGLLNNIEELKYVIHKQKPDLCIVSETHTTTNILSNEININGFKLLRTDSHSSRTGGVAVYIRNKIHVTNIKSYAENFIWLNSFELLASNNRIIKMAAVYMSASENKTEILKYFENWCEHFCEIGEILICGDFNIDVARESPYSQRLMKICNDNGLKQIVKNTTRQTNHSATIIDLCITNSNSIATVSMEDQISDHYNIEISVKNELKSKRIDKKLIKILHNYSQTAVLNQIENWLGEWTYVRNENCDIKTTWLLHNLHCTVSEFIVERVISNSDNFFNYELEKMRKQKNYLYKQAQLSTNDSNKWHAYKNYKNDYKKMIKRQKYEYTQRQLNNAAGDQKKTWKLLNSIITDKHVGNDFDIIESNGVTLNNKKNIADEFNKYFVDTISEINRSIPITNHTDNIPHQQENLFEFKSVDILELAKMLCSMSKKSNRDCFEISVSILLDCFDAIGPILTDIINSSLSSYFPLMLRQSIIVPIQKVSGTILIEEHRPINTLPCIEKIIEKFACEQLKSYIEEANILCAEQSGFRDAHSCESALNYVINEWKEAQGSNETVLAVFLDFQRAFETIDREILLHKLEMCGIGANALIWFNSYLSNRSQIVKINGVTSEPLENNYGVPQGSVLGPILFILYINDMKNVLQYCKIKLFADDTLIYICSKDINDATIKLNDDLNCLFNKISHDKLKLNVNKTKLMIISNKKTINKNEIQIKINNELIKLEHEIKYLGVILDDKLNLSENLNYVIRKMAKKVNVLYRTGDKLNKEQKLQVYKTTIEPHINYCSSVLFLSNETELNRLQKIQNKCMRCILKVNRFCSSNILLSSLGLLNCKEKIMMNTLVSIYKIVHNLWPMYLSNKIKHNSDNIRKNTLRSRNNLQTNSALKGYTQNSLFYKGINMYNNLPIEIRNEQNVYKFKTKLIEYIKNI